MQIKQIVISALACAISVQAAVQYPAHQALSERLAAPLLGALLDPVFDLVDTLTSPAKEVVKVIEGAGVKLAEEGKDLAQAGETLLEKLAGELAPSLKDLTDDLESITTYINEAFGRDLAEASKELKKGFQQIIKHLTNVFDSLADGGCALAQFLHDAVGLLSDAGVALFKALYDGSKGLYKELGKDFEPLIVRLHKVGADVEDLLIGLGKSLTEIGGDAAYGK